MQAAGHMQPAAAEQAWSLKTLSEGHCKLSPFIIWSNLFIKMVRKSPEERPAPKEQPPRKLSGKKTALLNDLERGT